MKTLVCESGMDALSCLGPDQLSSAKDEARPVVSEHLENLVANQLGHAREWLRSFALGFCPESGLPIAKCEGCQQGEPSSDPSRFAQGSTDRVAPHAHEFRAAIKEVISQIYRIFWLARSRA